MGTENRSEPYFTVHSSSLRCRVNNLLKEVGGGGEQKVKRVVLEAVAAFLCADFLEVQRREHRQPVGDLCGLNREVLLLEIIVNYLINI